MKVYIAGPMTGYPEFNFPRFFKAEEEWRAEGWEVINPAREDVGQGFDPKTDKALPHHVYMKRDLPLLCGCDAIAFLPGWEKSKGAMNEYRVAQMCGIAMYDAVTGGPLRDMPAETILEEAQRLVHGNRQADYGHPIDDFSRTGKLWGTILELDEPVAPDQVALCMVALKISREINKPKRDNRVDGCGYFETLDMIRQQQGEDEEETG